MSASFPCQISQKYADRSGQPQILLIAGSWAILGSIITGTQVFGYAVVRAEFSVPQPATEVNLFLFFLPLGAGGTCGLQIAGLDFRVC